MFLKARQSKVHAGQDTVTKNQTKWNTLYTPDYLSNLTRNQNFLSKSIESRKYSMFLEARHSKVHAGQETVTKNQSRCNRRKRAIRGIRNAIRSRKYVTERVRRCENKKRARRGKDKCIKGCDLENGGGLRRLNLFLVHSSQTNRERKRKREREKERERERTSTPRQHADDVSLGRSALFLLLEYSNYFFLLSLFLVPRHALFPFPLQRLPLHTPTPRIHRSNVPFFRRRGCNGTTASRVSVFSAFIVA